VKNNKDKTVKTKPMVPETKRPFFHPDHLDAQNKLALWGAEILRDLFRNIFKK
jgi:hypothetical protein